MLKYPQMAVTYLNIKVTNPQKGTAKLERRFLVDSGAVFSVIPEKELKKLGIKPDTKQTFVLANGEEIEKQVGEARFTWKDTQRTAPVVFGEEGVYLLGATTLEAMGVILDPVNRKLEKLPMIL
jgi:clan AA aspartic protease